VLLHVLDPMLEVDGDLMIFLAVDVPGSLSAGKGGFATQEFNCVEVDIESSVISHGADVPP